jgi:hypothetical protein
VLAFEALNELGLSYEENKQTKKALAAYQGAVKVRPFYVLKNKKN